MSLDYTKYQNPLSYPKRKTGPTPYQLKEALKQHIISQDECDAKIETYNEIEALNKRDLKIYYAKDKELADQFKVDLYEEYGVTNNPKNDLLFSKAYELGHSAGYQEIENYFSDLVDLIL